MKVMLWSALVSLVCAGMGQMASAQTARGDLHLPRPTNMNSFYTEDLQRDRPGFPQRFALPYGITNQTLGQGKWESGANGTAVWKMTITAEGSESLNIGFSQFMMPRSGQLTISSIDGQTKLRPFTAWDNERHGQLWTPPVNGQGLQLELRVAANERNQVRLQIGVVNYGYRQLQTMREGRSGSCNIDVACNQEVSWNNPIRAVAAITVNGRDTCTGFLVNNTAQDRRPLFMTAHHCGIGASNASSVVAIWNYHNSSCRQPNSPMSGQNGDGKREHFNSGATFRASHAASDFAIIEFDDALDPAHQLFLAGWDRSGAESPFTVGIHHPSVAEKRISFSQVPSTTTGYLRNEVPGAGTHVRVARWTQGTTEPGSSGSPLFDSNGRVIGQLHGGGASCQRPNDSDWYGRLSVSWEGGGTPATRLKDWLDPINSGAAFMDGVSAAVRR